MRVPCLRAALAAFKAADGRDGLGGRVRVLLSSAAMANPRARDLRRSMTDAERRLWSVLRDRRLHGHKFRRQHPLGPFVLDFACIEHRVAVEADGGQHADNAADQRRTAWLEGEGWRVLRFWNNDILGNPAGVAETILRALDTASSEAGARGPSPSQP